MDEIKLASLMSEARLISASENVLFPLIKLKQQQRMDLACAKFVGGEKDFISDIAYIQALKEIENQLKKLQTAGNKADLELHKDQIK
jgi:hypothetical protein